MLIRLGYDLELTCDKPMELVALLDPHPDAQRACLWSSGLQLDPAVQTAAYRDFYGNECLRMSVPAGRFRIARDWVMSDSGLPDPWNEQAGLTPVADLPHDVLGYLRASRYCETDLLMDRAWALFGGVPPGWQQVRAIFDFVNGHLTFGYPHARATRTAAEAFDERIGVCRDFAHLAITLCRCMNIPARYVNGYLGDIGIPPDPAPMDFNAWSEVWLDGAWHVFDARHNQPRIGRIAVARGRDATDVPLIHTFGTHELRRFTVWTEETPAPVPDQPMWQSPDAGAKAI